MNSPFTQSSSKIKGTEAKTRLRRQMESPDQIHPRPGQSGINPLADPVCCLCRVQMVAAAESMWMEFFWVVEVVELAVVDKG